MIVAIIATGQAASAALPHTPPPGTSSPWQLVFADEFNGTSVDTTKWNTFYYPNIINTGHNELQAYTPSALSVQNGFLRIRADKQPLSGYNYTSGIIQSRDKFAQLYGYFEIRARVPKGRGLWASFWMLPQSQNWPPEIDVVESLGHETNTTYMTHHWHDASTNTNPFTTNYVIGPDYSLDYHTYAVQWAPSLVVWYVDGVESSRATQHISTEAMYMLMNLAVGGDWPGSPDVSTPFPSFYDIDYVHVYQRELPTIYLPKISR
jgi:beta-glucanase (GH16 family)